MLLQIQKQIHGNFIMIDIVPYMIRFSKGAHFSRREKDTTDELVELDKSDTESFAEVSESDLIALALSPTGDEDQNSRKLASLPSDSTLNSVSLTDADTVQG